MSDQEEDDPKLERFAAALRKTLHDHVQRIEDELRTLGGRKRLKQALYHLRVKQAIRDALNAKT